MDKCKWTEVSMLYGSGFKPACGTIFTMNHYNNNEFIYCPFCGNEIEHDVPKTACLKCDEESPITGPNVCKECNGTGLVPIEVK